LTLQVVYNVKHLLRHFEVSRALINQHSDTMLEKSVSEAWNEDPEEAVYIDRDGNIFSYACVELHLLRQY